MTLKTTLAELKALGDERVRKHYAKNGATGDMFGVKLGDIRKVAKKLKTDHAFALKLWATKNIDARFLAILIMDPKELSAKEMDQMVRSVKFDRVADWLNSYVIKHHPELEKLRVKWMKAKHPMALRAGWNWTASLAAKDAKGLDLDALLDRLEAEMGKAAPAAQWTMNICLANIGIYHKKHRKRALAIGEEIGLYREYPEVKGCTSPFAPIWINEMVSRQG